ncbi:hypothetical protein [Fischerella thermalis]|uniref:hypothetical protein n=1 Tax=Fischerella thermalis TaxID=372787 RepID=UPI0015F0A172|nr:hypothetical protein [Fischerella thermalis]
MIGNKNFIKAPNLPQHKIVRQAKAVTQRRDTTPDALYRETRPPHWLLYFRFTL